LVDGRQEMVGTKALRYAAGFVLLSVEPFDNTIVAQIDTAVNDSCSVIAHRLPYVTSSG